MSRNASSTPGAGMKLPPSQLQDMTSSSSILYLFPPLSTQRIQDNCHCGKTLSRASFLVSYHHYPLVVRPCLQFSLLYHSLSTDRTTAIVVGPCLSSSPTPPYILNTQNNRHCGKTLSIIFLYSFIYHQQAQQLPLW